MKKLLSLLLVLCLMASFAACGEETAPAPTTAAEAPTAETIEPAPTRPTGKEALQGKKIIFIGNSYTFFGNTVIFKNQDVLTQAERSYDHGYFYQLCKKNDIEVAVTNWTFGSHDISSMFGGACYSGELCLDEYHEYYLQDAYFDYVCIQPYKEKEFTGDIITHLQYTMDFFRKANPNVHFLLLVPHMAAEKNYDWYKQIGKLHDKAGVTICNWGGMLHDISEGKTQVPGGTLTYDRSSFVNSKDNHHENLLAGYITTLMVYCAITGESAVGQPYDFCNDSTLDSHFDFAVHKTKYYPDGGETNFIEIFQSEVDMQGLQSLTDQYIAQFNGGN